MAVVIHSKEAGVIIDRFMQNWVAIYGPPEIGLFTDKGLEFNYKTFQEMAEKLNLSLQTFAAYSPWSNGIDIMQSWQESSERIQRTPRKWIRLKKEEIMWQIWFEKSTQVQLKIWGGGIKLLRE